jgi:cell division septal protein FtsQ
LRERLRSLLSYFPTILKIVLAIVVGALLFTGYRAAASASFFQIRQVEVQGANRASAGELQSIVRREVSKSGVWNADLTDLSAKLERLPWVRSAIVSRVLPDGIRVRIVERLPLAVVRTSAGRFRWVDEAAVLLGEMTPEDQMPAFFLRGLSEETSETARRENVERVKLFMELQRVCEMAGIAERVSEINTTDLRDLRAQLAGDDSQIEVRLGGQEPGKRLKEGIRVLDEQRQTPRGQFISYIDLSQGKRAVVGFTSGSQVAPATGEAVEKSASQSQDRASTTAAREAGPASREKSRQDSRSGTRMNR